MFPPVMKELITRFIVINIAQLTELFCNCPLLKDISSYTKCLLVWCDLPVIKRLVRMIFGINYSRDIWKFQNFQKCIWAIYHKLPSSQTCDY